MSPSLADRCRRRLYACPGYPGRHSGLPGLEEAYTLQAGGTNVVANPLLFYPRAYAKKGDQQ